MGRSYAVQFENVAVTTARDLFEIVPADDKPVRLLGIFLSQSSDVGDSEEEMLRIQVIRGHSTAGSGGTSVTPAPLDPTDAAAGFTAKTNNTTIASAGSPVVLHSESLNIRSGLGMWWIPEAAPRANQTQTTIVVRLLAAPADSVTMNGTLYIEEV